VLLPFRSSDLYLVGLGPKVSHETWDWPKNECAQAKDNLFPQFSVMRQSKSQPSNRLHSFMSQAPHCISMAECHPVRGAN